MLASRRCRHAEEFCDEQQGRGRGLPQTEMIQKDSSCQSFIARLPKVELHVHLEGSARPQALRELVRAKGRHERVVEKWIAAREQTGYHYAGFSDFIDSFTAITLLLETPADYALITTRLCEWLAEQNVRYAEVTLSAGVVLWKKQCLEAVIEAVAAAARDAEKRLGLRIQWILDAIRQFGAAHAREVLHRAARFRHEGVVAFGIGGDEARGPAEHFSEVYRECRELGLHTTAHAGETLGPESVRKAVELLGAERVGHGLSATRDPEVMALLRDRQVPLEVCLSSNVATGSLARVEDHPVRKFLDERLVVTLNTDDPAMFGTSLTREFGLAARCFSLGREMLVGLCENAIRASFMEEYRKQALRAELRQAAAE